MGNAGSTPTCVMALSEAKKMPAQRAQPFIANRPIEVAVMIAPTTMWNQPQAVKSHTRTPWPPPAVTTWSLSTAPRPQIASNMPTMNSIVPANTIHPVGPVSAPPRRDTGSGTVCATASPFVAVSVASVGSRGGRTHHPPRVKSPRPGDDGGAPAAHDPRVSVERSAPVSNLIAIAYPDLATAQQVADNVTRLQAGHELELDDLVVVERRGDGKIKLHQPSLAGRGATGGALWGGVIGLIFFMPLFGMAIGAASGAAAGAMSDAGVDDAFLKDLGSKLQPGGAAVIALVRQANMEKILSEVKIPGEVIQTSLTGDSEQALRDALSKAGAAA